MLTDNEEIQCQPRSELWAAESDLDAYDATPTCSEASESNSKWRTTGGAKDGICRLQEISLESI